MAISGRDCSQSVVKKVPFSSKKKKTTSNQGEEESRGSRSVGHQSKSSKSCSIQKGLFSMTKKKSAAVFPQLSMVDIDNNNDEFGNDKAFHGEEGLWLSSDNTSISSFFEDQSTISYLLFLYGAPVFSNEGTTFFDELSNPLKTWRSILDTESTIEEDLEGEEEIVNWLLSSAEDNHDHTTYYSSCCSASFSSESTICDSSSIGSSIDVDRLSSWVSLMNLDGEEDSCNDLSSTGHDSDGTAEPLFWPFERECDWSTTNPMEEAWDGFCMSPLNDTNKPRFAESRVRSRVGGSTVEEGFGSCRKRLVFSSESPAASKQGSSKKCSRRISTNKSRKALKGESSTKVSDNKISSIEMIVGLCEFDGHEGVDLDFDKDEFTLL